MNILAEHGAGVDRKTQVVKFPRDLVMKYMATVPRYFSMGAREPVYDLDLSQGNTYFTTDGCGVETFDYQTGKLRPSCKADVGMMAPALPMRCLRWDYLADGQRPRSWRDRPPARTGCQLQQFHQACPEWNRDGRSPGPLCRPEMATVISGSREQLASGRVFRWWCARRAADPGQGRH